MDVVVLFQLTSFPILLKQEIKNLHSHDEGENPFSL